MNKQGTQSVARSAEAINSELVERIAGVASVEGEVEPFHGLHLYRFSAPTEPVHGASTPSLCVIAQGRKEVLLGDEHFYYDPAHYLLATVELPTVSRIVVASAAQPYFGLRLDLDLATVGSVMLESGHVAARDTATPRAIDVSSLGTDLLDAVLRLVRLVDSPSEDRFLLPMITREIIYRLLVGAQGDRLRQMTTRGENAYRIGTAIEQMRTEFDQPLRIEAIAQEAGMSVSGFYHHFKAVTGMSPLQFQKRQRLQEARRLMLGERLDAVSTALRVGYDDASHFNREYKRLFGAPPCAMSSNCAWRPPNLADCRLRPSRRLCLKVNTYFAIL